MNGEPSRDLLEAQQRNESGPHRSVGLVVETRPDWVTPKSCGTSASWGDEGAVGCAEPR